MDESLLVSPVLAEQISRGAAQVQAGAITDDAFKPLRLSGGAHRQRQGDGYMVRIRIPGGRLTLAQWQAVAAVAVKRAQRAHFTLRQDIQFYGVGLEDIGDTVNELAMGGVSTYAAGGSTVRNITAAVLGDQDPGFAFDPYPFAYGLSVRLSRHPLFNHLPRKFKIGFGGPGPEQAQGWLNDLGFIPALSAGKRGFRVVAGGGLGASPQNGFEIEAFLPAERAFSYAEAALETFASVSPKDKPLSNRFKFILRAQGLAAVREAIHGRLDGKADELPLEAPVAALGTAAAWVEAPLGDLSPGQLLGLGRALADAGAQDLRISFDQRLFVPGLAPEALPALLKAALTLGLPAAEQPADLRLVVCAGPDTCNRGLVNSKALGKALQGFDLPAELHISGCQNGCSQHLVAPLGLQGSVRSTPKGRQPCYVLRAGLPVGGAGLSFGAPLLTLPARRVRPALEALSVAWRAEAAATPFGDWLSAQPKGGLEARLGAGFNDGEDAWLDLGSDQPFEVQLGGSECH